MKKVLAMIISAVIALSLAACVKPQTPPSPETAAETQTGAETRSEAPEPTVCPGTYTELSVLCDGVRFDIHSHKGSMFELLLHAEENGIMEELIKVGAEAVIEPVYPNAYDSCRLKEALVYLDQGCVTEYRFSSFEEALEYAREHIELDPVIDMILLQDNEEAGYAFALVGETADLPSTVPDPPAAGQYFWLVDGGETVLPYMEFAYGTTYVPAEGDNEGGMLHADGKAFFQGILGEARKFPCVSRGCETALYADSVVTGIRVYDAVTRERLADGIKIEELPGVIEANGQALIVEITVNHEGEFIEEAGKHEYDAYMYGYFVRSDGGERPLLSEMTDEELRTALMGLGVEVPEEPPYDIGYLARLFEEDINAPYPSDIYFDEAHNFFENVRRAVKIYYGVE